MFPCRGGDGGTDGFMLQLNLPLPAVGPLTTDHCPPTTDASGRPRLARSLVRGLDGFVDMSRASERERRESTRREGVNGIAIREIGNSYEYLNTLLPMHTSTYSRYSSSSL